MRDKAIKIISKITLKVIGLFILFLFSQNTEAQLLRRVVKPVDLSPRNVVGIAAHDGGLYQAYLLVRADKKRVLYLSFYNNITWQNMATLFLDSQAVVSNIKVSPKGEVVVYGNFDYKLALDNTTYKNIVFFDGAKWAAVKPSNGFKENSIINEIAWNKDTLYLGGFFDSIEKVKTNHLAKLFDGTIYPIIDQNSVSGTNGAVKDLAFHKDQLYISGEFTQAGSKICNGFSYQTGNKWNIVNKTFLKGGKFTFLGDDVIIHDFAGTNNIYKINIIANTTTSMNLGITEIKELNDIVVFENQVYAVGDFKLFGIDSSFGWIGFENSIWNTVNIASNGKFLEATDDNLYIVGTHLLSYLSQVSYQYTGVYNSKQKLIRGFLYLDRNSNCEIDNGVDFPLSNRSLRFGTDKNTIYTNKLGVFYYYFTDSEDKKPSLLMDNKFFEYELCIKDSNKLKNITGNLIDSINIAVSPIGLNKARLDTRIIVHGGQKIRQAGKNVVSYLITNIGLAEASNIKVTLNGTQKMKDLLTKSSTAHTVKDSSIEWNIPNIRPLGSAYITLVYGIQDNADVVGNQLDFSIDYNYFNNVEAESGQDNFSQIVSDEDLPALKEQSLPNKPQGESAFIAAADTIIEYQITFQNRNASAVQEVVVVDTVDLRYNLLYIQTIAGSHPFTSRIAQDPSDPNIGYLIYTFSNINLEANPSGDPELTTDEGYIKFRYVFDRKHQINDEVKNTATVIMDDANHYPTNSVVCSVDRLVSTPKINTKNNLTLFPNPCGHELNVRLPNKTSFDYKIMDLTGATIISESNVSNLKIETQALPSGIFILLVEQDEHISVGKFVKN